MTPIGYLNIDADGKIAGKFYDHEKQTSLITLGRSLRRVEKDPLIAPLIRSFFDWYLVEPRTLKQSAQYMNHLGIKSPRFKGKYSISMIERILKNPFYSGQMRYEHELFSGVHDPIITSREFSDIQSYLSGKSHPMLVKHDFVYRGLIQCAECGCSIVGVRKKKLSGKEYEYYTCSKRRGTCGQKPLKPAEIDIQVHEKLQAVYIDERVWELCKKLIKLHFASQLEKQGSHVEQWGRDLSLLDKKLANLLDAHLSETVTKEDYIAKKNELLNEKAHIEQKIKDGGSSTRHWLLDAETFFDKAHHAFTRFADPDVDISEKKQILRSIGWNLRLFDGNLEWHYKKPFDILATQILDLQPVGTNAFVNYNKKTSSFAESPLLIESWRDAWVQCQICRGVSRAF